MKKNKDRKIILESGREFYGKGFGSGTDKICEIVFNTSMAGYQEILSDPSYTDQAVVMTYPLIGNYGMAADDYESARPSASGMIVREYNDEPSNFRSEKTLGEVMEAFDISGISGIDTRALTRIIRDNGTGKVLITDADTPLERGLDILRAAVLPTDAVSRVSCPEKWISYSASTLPTDAVSRVSCPEKWVSYSASTLPTDAVSRVSCPEKWVSYRSSTLPPEADLRVNFPEKWISYRPSEAAKAGHGYPEIPTVRNAGTLESVSAEKQEPLNADVGRHVVAIDCGMKLNIVRFLNRRGCHVTVVPWNTSAAEIRALSPDGILISNGPGDPTDVPETIEAVRSLLGSYPVFGICLGHQILSLAYGASTYKLKFGHRGGNHPVKNLATGRIEITSQNHSYAVDSKSFAGTPLQATHINLLDMTIEGVECAGDRAFGVQYHPESSPGPQDSAYLFDRFLKIMR